MKVELEERLPVWVADDLLAPAQADAILAAERQHRREAGQGESRISLLAEALGYVGATLAVVAVSLIIGEFWDQLETWAKTALSGLLTVAVSVTAYALREHAEPAVRRLVSLLWVAAVIGVGFTVGLPVEASDIDEETAVFLTSGVATVAALLAYVRRRTVLQHLTLLAAGLTTIGSGTSSLDTSLEPAFWGLLFLGVGLAWAAMAWGDLLRPRTTGLLAGLTVAGIGAQVMAFDDEPLLGITLAIVISLGLVGLSIADRRTLLLAFGSVGLFVFVPQLVFELFGDSLGAPVALLISGLLLLVGAVGAARVKSEVLDDDTETFSEVTA